MPVEFSAQNHQTLCKNCKGERLDYLQDNRSPSPACVELFRRALASATQQATWPCLDEIFTPLLTTWARGQHPFPLEDVVQETWLRFLRSSITTFQIQDDNRLELILAFLRKTLGHIVLEWLRKEPPTPIDLLDVAETIKDPAMLVEQTHLRIDLERYIGEFLAQENFTEEERFLFQLKFYLRLKPREIQAEFPELAGNYAQLEVALQRISRRVKNYTDFHNLQSPRQKSDDRALLQLEDEKDKIAQINEEAKVDEPCIYEEGVLLDYIMGMVEAEIATAIEASPACLQQARELAQTFGAFLQVSYRLDCPNPEQLVDYQQRTVSGIERLLLYRHLEQCPRCRTDLLVLESMDGSTNIAQSSPFRRIVEAIYESPLAYGLQGGWLHYRTPELFINISSRQNRGQARSWTVRVQVRSQEGALLTAVVESAILEGIGHTMGRLYPLDREQIAQEESSLAFREVAAGTYCLSLRLPDEEITIRQIAVGVDDEGNG